MAAEATIRPVRAGDAEALAQAMRQGDVAECAALGLEPLAAVRESLAESAVSFAVELGGELAALGGVAPTPPRTLLGRSEFGVVWLLTGGAVDRHRGAFWRASRSVMAALRERHPVLLNHIDARYAAALRWAARLGAEVQPAVAWSPSGLPFHPVIWRSPWA